MRAMAAKILQLPIVAQGECVTIRPCLEFRSRIIAQDLCVISFSDEIQEEHNSIEFREKCNEKDLPGSLFT